MKSKRARAAALCILLGLGAAALGETYTWEGEGEDYDWTTCDNWACLYCSICYPNSNKDTARFLADWPAHEVNLTTVTLDEVAAYGPVNFHGSGTVTAGRLEIHGATFTGTLLQIDDSGYLLVE